MKTVCVQIGNSDNKLSQKEWAAFVHDVEVNIKILSPKIHFSGFSRPDVEWQNAAWIFDIDYKWMSKLVQKLKTIRINYRQDSVAWMEADTIFI